MIDILIMGPSFLLEKENEKCFNFEKEVKEEINSCEEFETNVHFVHKKIKNFTEKSKKKEFRAVIFSEDYSPEEIKMVRDLAFQISKSEKRLMMPILIKIGNHIGGLQYVNFVDSYKEAIKFAVWARHPRSLPRLEKINFDRY